MACEQAPHWVQRRCQKTGKKPSASRERDRCGKISNELFLVISKIIFIVHIIPEIVFINVSVNSSCANPLWTTAGHLHAMLVPGVGH